MSTNGARPLAGEGARWRYMSFMQAWSCALQAWLCAAWTAHVWHSGVMGPPVQSIMPPSVLLQAATPH
jgi:hypothetical protein